MPYPQNFIYDPLTQTLSWDAVQDIAEYQIDYKDTLAPVPTWLTCYIGGTETSCVFDFAPSTYNVHGRTKTRPGKPWDIWSPEEQVIVT